MTRPQPDALLARLQADQPDGRGKLKIFLGYAAGVGKTYAMLQSARRLLAQGVDLVVGLVECHGRPETEALLEGLPQLPLRRLSVQHVEVEEFDLDACLARKPALVLVDELAHSNPPGCRHRKRYQDVEELLEAGIDVYTTLNVQHLESLNDAVLQITGVQVRETLPDTFLERAHSLALVDLPPEELLQRLKAGHVYREAAAERAREHFFRAGNLTALRELALRSAAERVDDDVLQYMQQRSISGPWPVKERLLVAVGPSPLSERLVRSTRRLAEALGAEWWAVSVRSAHPLNAEAQARVFRHLQLAESLGAKTTVVQGLSIPEALIHFARQQNVTKVVAGKPLGSAWPWQRDLVDQIIRLSGDIDVFVVSAQAPPQQPGLPVRLRQPARYLQAGVATLLVTMLALPLRQWLAPTNLVMLYLLTACAVAYRLGRGPSALSSAVGVALFDLLFVPPYYTFAVKDREYFLTFASLLSVSLAVSHLTSRAREQAAAAREREAETATVFALSRSLSATQGELAIGERVAQQLAAHLRQQVQFLPAQMTHWPSLSDGHRALASWSTQHLKPAGKGTDTLSESDVLCRPLQTSQGELLGALLLQLTAPLLPDQRRLLDTFAGQAEVAMERDRLSQLRGEAELLRATEQLQATLLNSVSHDLRIPLVSIQGALQSLQAEAEGQPLPAESRQLLVNNAVAETQRLNRIVANLLQMNRLKAGYLSVQLQPQELGEVLQATLQQMHAEDRVELVLPEDLPLVQADFLLLQQVFVNLLENAFKYAPEAPIRVSAECREGGVQIRFVDEGPGIPEALTEHLFECFVRGHNEITGSGLGLSICRGLMQAMGGSISLDPQVEGTCFQLELKAA